MSIRVVVLVRHAAFSEGICALLGWHDDIDVVAANPNTNIAAGLAAALQPDVMVIDVGVSFRNRAELIRSVVEQCPAVKVLALGMETDRRLIDHVLEAGAWAYVCEESVFEQLAPAIRAVAAGCDRFDANPSAVHTAKSNRWIQGYGDRESGDTRFRAGRRTVKR